jgi:protein-disulfide isomerase
MMHASGTPKSSRWLAVTAIAAGLVGSAVLLPACSAQTGSAMEGDAPSGVLARVNGQDVTEAEVTEKSKPLLDNAEAQLNRCQADYKQARYEIYENGVKQVIEERLIAAEAQKRGVSAEDLVATEVTNKLQPVTDADVDAWYQENQARLRGRAKEEIADQIKSFLEETRKQEAHSDFVNGLRKEAQVTFLLEPPRVSVEAVGPSRGPESAPVTIVEFSDFECPFCSRVNPTLEQVKKEYGDKVRVVFRQFPLNIHPNAPKAAEASLCAHEQGKFWEMHDLMFAEQRQLTVPDLKTKAERISLDTARFNECLDSGKYAPQVQKDLAAGTQAGVSGTPAMFVNGRLVSGAVPFEAIAEVIDMELSRGKASGK